MPVVVAAQHADVGARTARAGPLGPAAVILHVEPARRLVVPHDLVDALTELGIRIRLETGADAEGDVAKLFAPLTADANRLAVQTAWKGIDAGVMGSIFFKPGMARNIAKAKLLYDTIDASALYENRVEKADRSRMNVTFFLRHDELTPAFLAEAENLGLAALRGHRAVGGVRASIYNAMPLAGCEALAAHMRDFERRHG